MIYVKPSSISNHLRHGTQPTSRGGQGLYARAPWRHSCTSRAGKPCRTLSSSPRTNKAGKAFKHNRSEALQAWAAIARALGASDGPSDRQLSASIERYVRQMPIVQAVLRQREKAKSQERPGDTKPSTPQPERRGPDIER